MGIAVLWVRPKLSGPDCGRLYDCNSHLALAHDDILGPYY
jgi:hypothetical protein